jgi:hypothetical protein
MTQFIYIMYSYKLEIKFIIRKKLCITWTVSRRVSS